MYVTYKPDGGDVQEWSFHPRKMPSNEAEAIERATDMTWAEFSAQVMKGSVRARRALLWILLRRTHPTLKFADVAFTMDELDMSMDSAELAAMRTELEKVDDDDVRALALRQIDDEIAEAEAKDSPKVSSSSDESGTG
jgi:hypothetical protein